MASETSDTDTADTTEMDVTTTTTAAEATVDTALVKEDVFVDTTPAPATFEITLDEFMQKLSMRDGRVELINAFHFTEKLASSIKDLESTFQARFIAFTNMVIEG